MQPHPHTRRAGFAPPTSRRGLAMLLGAAALAACGVDDAPTAPTASLTPNADVVAEEAVISLAEAKTEARVGVTASGLEAVRLGLHAELDGLSRLDPSNVVVTWEQAGGISPQPFVVAIPAACFVSDRTGLVVEDFRGCGLRATLGGEAVALSAFEAALMPPPDEGVPALLDLAAVLVPPEPVAPALLGALGGGGVEVAIGEAVGGAPPLGIQTVSGISPEPFVVGSGLSLAEAKTEARVGVTASGGEAVRLGLHAELDGLSRLDPSNVVVTWEQEGGIQPQPFVVAIPAGCFVSGRTGLVVEDFRGCGLRATLGGEAVALSAFEAALMPPPDEGVPALLDLAAVLVPPEPIAPALLGALGGGGVEVAIGEAVGGAPPLGIETVSGIQPEPF